MSSINLMQQQHIIRLRNQAALHRVYSPDIVALERFDNHILFIYDSMMNLFLRHQVLHLNSAAYIGKYQTNDMHFIMMLYKKTHRENYPVVLREKSKHARCIYGEAYSVSPHVLMIIDKLNQNHVQCTRVREEIFAVGETPEDRQKHFAWMYIGKPDFWETKISTEDNTFKTATVQNFATRGTAFYRFFPSDQSRELFPQYT